jgi:glyoxylase-like metal-dependent hydrolase (beta-lactamase superfamily II)
VTTIEFGSVSITQVTELTGWRFPANGLYPDLTTEAFDRAAGQCGERFADPATGELMLDINCFAVRAPGALILIDAGNGNDKHRPVMTPHHMFHTDFPARLRAAGVDREEVSVVVATHLHQDHCGWQTMLVGGEWVPTFPNARHLYSARELRHVADFGRTAPDGSLEYDFYRTFDDTVLPVLLAGLARTFTGRETLFDDGRTRMWAEEVAGHTPGHLVVHLEHGDEHAVFSGDAIHHPLQFADLDLPQVGDVDRRRAAAVRRELVATCLKRDSLLFAAHFPGPGRVVRTAPDRLGFAWL